jgi:uncharacterized membrane protein
MVEVFPMKSSTVGVSILVIGIIILLVGLVFWVSTPSSNSSALLATTRYVVSKGDEISIGIPLATGSRISGNFSQINGTTVNFYFMNSTQQNVFASCAPCSSPSIINASNPSKYTYNLEINSTGTYYLVLDNSNGLSKEGVSLFAQSVTPNNVYVDYEIITILGLIVAIIGAVVFLVSRRKKVGSSGADSLKPASDKQPNNTQI